MLAKFFSIFRTTKTVRHTNTNPMVLGSTAMGLDLSMAYFLDKWSSWLWGAKTSTALSSNAKAVREATAAYKKPVSKHDYKGHLAAVQKRKTDALNAHKFKEFAEPDDLLAVARHGKVRSANLSKTKFSPAGFANFTNTLPDPAYLAKVDFSETPVDLNAGAIPSLSGLKSFKANSCTISGDGSNFFNALPTGLKTLELGKVAFSNEEVVDKFCNFLEGSEVFSLVIPDFKLPDASPDISVAKVLKAIEGKPIKNLSFGGNTIGFESYPLLQGLFEGKISKLDLSNVCDDGLISKYLNLTPEKLSGVTYLNLENTGLTAESILDMFKGFADAEAKPAEEAKPTEEVTKKKGRGRPRKIEEGVTEAIQQIVETNDVTITAETNDVTTTAEIKDATTTVNESLVLDLSGNTLDSKFFPVIKGLSRCTKDLELKFTPTPNQYGDLKELISNLSEHKDRKIKLNFSDCNLHYWQLVILDKHANTTGNVKVGPTPRAGFRTKAEVKFEEIFEEIFDKSEAKQKPNMMARE
jgi:hypothetical protein